MQYPVAAFDLDGTLVDTAPDLLAALDIALTGDGYEPLPAMAGRDMIGRGAKAMIVEALRAQGVDLASAPIDDMHGRFLDHYRGNIAVASRPFPGVAEALDRLAAANVRLVVCTNKFEDLSRLLLEQLGLADRFAAVVGADTLGVRKPDPAHVRGAIELAGGTTERAVMVGDSKFDIEAAKQAKVPVVAVDFGYTDTPVAALEPDAVISHFDALWPHAARWLRLGEESDAAAQ